MPELKVTEPHEVASNIQEIINSIKKDNTSATSEVAEGGQS
jgi:hypothetical protein